MAQCVYGQKRKGTRQCPALGGFICAKCCGRHRGVDIDCPTDCVYFVEHGAYQREKQRKTVEPAWLRRNKEIAMERGREAVSFITYLEMVICSELDARFAERVEGRPTLDDLMVLDAYEYLRRQLSPLSVKELVAPALGDRLWDASQQYLEGNALPQTEAQATLDTLISFVETLRASGDKREYIEALLLLYTDKLKQLREGQEAQTTRRIMTPEEFRQLQEARR